MPSRWNGEISLVFGFESTVLLRFPSNIVYGFPDDRCVLDLESRCQIA